ncbi:hypothetical protein [Streptomyces sp. NRRL F-5630]|uniref:hypothetical protein n=1 Tax=Streptomyces sp. NRRL F-5630 TaxID=1463864 RepID=UPI003EBE20B1
MTAKLARPAPEPATEREGVNKDCPRCAELRREELRAERAYDYSTATDCRVLMRRCRHREKRD